MGAAKIMGKTKDGIFGHVGPAQRNFLCGRGSDI